MQRMLKFMVWCLYVHHKPVFYQNGWNDHAGIFTVGLYGSLWLIHSVSLALRRRTKVMFSSKFCVSSSSHEANVWCSPRRSVCFSYEKKTSRLNCSLCSECCLFEGREASLRLTLTDFLSFPSADAVSDVASWYIRCKCSFFPVLVGSFERTCLNWPNLVAWDAKDFSRSRTCATDYHWYF